MLIKNAIPLENFPAYLWKNTLSPKVKNDFFPLKVFPIYSDYLLAIILHLISS